ncbi:MAG: hypothetical protein R2727_07470 [Bacteroidales bacterium]
MGVRVEHPQVLIDKIQYHGSGRGEYLPAASYSLVARCQDRGVYSFCMCPGGFIVPSATAGDEMVVNGMSPSAQLTIRQFRNNSGDTAGRYTGRIQGSDNMGGIRYQKWVENLAYENGNRSQAAPAQRLTDFIGGSFRIPSLQYHTSLGLPGSA